MKKQLFSKMRSPKKQQEVIMQTESSNMASSSSTMAAFDALPVAPKPDEKSPVNDFLDKVEEQEKTELEMLADKDRASINAAHKGLVTRVED
jgi:hypothetical protein|tara:strand:- start:257 stop:532 length:276 start_codon:yes stop_codon:yes gene_type:complete